MHSVQKSVFEGDITQKKLEGLKAELERNIDVQQDSVCIYELESSMYAYKQQIGEVVTFQNIL